MNAIYLARNCLFVVILFTCFVAEIRGQEIVDRNLCKGNPCANKGLCVQTHYAPGYKCQCHGTGFHGPRCKQVCPKTARTSLNGRVPIECIEI